MDQSRIAGLGNLLCDEALWRAGVDPARTGRDARRPTTCAPAPRDPRHAAHPRPAGWIAHRRPHVQREPGAHCPDATARRSCGARSAGAPPTRARRTRVTRRYLDFPEFFGVVDLHVTCRSAGDAQGDVDLARRGQRDRYVARPRTSLHASRRRSRSAPIQRGEPPALLARAMLASESTVTPDGSVGEHRRGGRARRARWRGRGAPP